MIFFEIYDFYLHFDVERVAAQVVIRLEKALEVAPKGLVGGVCRGAGGGEGVATQVVVGRPEALEGGSGGSGRRHDD